MLEEKRIIDEEFKNKTVIIREDELYHAYIKESKDRFIYTVV